MGRGRFGLNIVCGWNADEFGMFGVEQRDTTTAMRMARSGSRRDLPHVGRNRPVRYRRRLLHLKNVEAEPKPFGGTRPIVMNAGASPAGQAFGIANCDMLFRNWRSLEINAQDNAASTAAAAAKGREIGVYTSGYVICRSTRREAEEYERYVVEENADWEAIDHLIELSMAGNQAFKNASPAEIAGMRRRMAAGHGGCPMVGTPDDVAAEMVKLHRSRVRRLCVLVRQLSRRVSVLPRRGAAAARTARLARRRHGAMINGSCHHVQQAGLVTVLVLPGGDAIGAVSAQTPLTAEEKNLNSVDRAVFLFGAATVAAAPRSGAVPFAELEGLYGGRLGVVALDTGNGPADRVSSRRALPDVQHV